MCTHMHTSMYTHTHAHIHTHTHTHTHTCWWRRYAGRRNKCVLAIRRSDDGHRPGKVGWGRWGRGQHPWGEKLRQFCRALHGRRRLAWLLCNTHTDHQHPLPLAKLHALVYDILPSTTAVFSYTTGSWKLSANEHFLVGAQVVVSLLQTIHIISDIL